VKISYAMQRTLDAAPADWEDCGYPATFGPIGRTVEALERRKLIEFRSVDNPASPRGYKWQWRKLATPTGEPTL
jgi:hypothetical protein